MVTYKITALYTSCLFFWNFFLVRNVIRKRLELKIGLGDSGNLDMIKSIRIHGNAIENIPLFLILMLVAESFGHSFISNVFLNLMGVAFLYGRFAHYRGLMQRTTSSKGRIIGTMLTHGSGALLSIYALLQILLSD